MITTLSLLAALLCSAALAPAQLNRVRMPNGGNGAGGGEVLPENYVLTLTATEGGKEVTEVAFTVATEAFSVSVPGSADLKVPTVTFSGTMTRDEGGRMLVRFGLGMEVAFPAVKGAEGAALAGNNAVQFKSLTTQGSVWLKVGEWNEILKAGGQTWRLSLEKLAGEPARGK